MEYSSNQIISIISTGIAIDGSYLEELEALIVLLQNDNYASAVARILLDLECEIVLWQYLNGGDYVYS